VTANTTPARIDEVTTLKAAIERLSTAVMKAEAECERLEAGRLAIVTQHVENERQLHRAIEKLKRRTTEAEENAERYRIERADLKAQLVLAREVCLARRKSLVKLHSDVVWLMERAGLTVDTEHVEKAIDLLPDRKIPDDASEVESA
jgi:hypothetical protein